MPNNRRRFPSPIVVLASLAVSALAPACGAPRIGPAHVLPESAGALFATAPDRYATDPGGAPASPESARVRAAFEAAIPPAARGAYTHEPALDRVAAAVAATASDEQPASQALVQWLFWRAGAISRYARVEILTPRGTDDVDAQAVELAGKMQAAPSPESYGVARSSRGMPAVAIVFGRRLLDVAPLPKSHAPGAPIAITVRPLEAVTELMLHTDEDGPPVRERFTANADGTFSITHKAPSRPGRYFLEVSGLEPRTIASTPENPWRESLLWVPVYVGVPEPTAPDDFIRAPAPNPPDATAWAARVLDGYNAARAKLGKKPLATDGRVTALANERSAFVARAGREPLPDVVLADKMAASGFPPRDYDERHSRVDSVSDYVGLHLLEPMARQRLLGTESIVVGVGLTPRAPNAKGEIDYLLVEEAVDPVARLDAARDRGKVYAALDALQTAEGRPAYKHDDDVSRVVQSFADEVCAGQKRANQTKTLLDKARGIGDKFHQWSSATWRSGYDYTRWEETSLFAKGKEPPLTHAAVGLCQGDLPGKPGGSYVVAVQFAP